MIDLYTWPTPNGRKIHIMLEETGLPYTVHAVNTRAGDQFKPEFLKINPNNKIPAIIDRNGPGDKPFTLYESGAILIYLAEKSGKFLPYEPAAKYTTLQWLMFQMGGVGPMLGQAHHFLQYAPEKIAFDPASLLPKDLGFYHYEGSLTTPPCTEGVDFYILKTPSQVSKEQVGQFPYKMNARPVQPLNGRKISEG